MMNGIHCKQGLILLILVILSSCAGLPEKPNWDQAHVYGVPDKAAKYQNAPIFVVDDPTRDYNRIGTARVWYRDNQEVVGIDPNRATVYTDKRKFTTTKGSYTNLLYRVHFERVPTFYLTAGENVGLIVVTTLNEKMQPLLYTLVHTCGCYLAFIPTSHLPAESFVKSWKKERQWVYGEILPSYLSFTPGEQEKLVIHLRDDTHRAKNVWLASSEERKQYSYTDLHVEPFSALEKLKLPDGRGGYTSFFETTGARKDYVKGSTKFWERLLISWWALDWRVGEDKRLGADKNDSIVFYTSLKPWAREESDLRDFARFLEYWGWRL